MLSDWGLIALLLVWLAAVIATQFIVVGARRWIAVMSTIMIFGCGLEMHGWPRVAAMATGWLYVVAIAIDSWRTETAKRKGSGRPR